MTVFYEALQANEVVACLSFDYGSKHNAKEIPFAKLHAERHGIPHHVVELDFMDKLFKSDLLKSGGNIPEGHYAEDSMKQTVVPFRNGIMLAVATGFAESIEAEGVMIAAHSGDHAIYPDCRDTFMQAMGDAMQSGTYIDLELLRPYVNMDKAAIAMRGNELGVNFSETWSCYKGGDIHCGVCGTCVERREAFLLAGISDPTTYEQTPELPKLE